MKTDGDRRERISLAYRIACELVDRWFILNILAWVGIVALAYWLDGWFTW